METENEDQRHAYDTSQLRKPRALNEIGGDKLALYHLFGNDVIGNRDIFLIECDVLVYILGNSVVFENLENNKKDYLLGIDEYGIGCIQVHPSRRLLAVGGRGSQPNIYIYSYPSLQVTKVLRNGAERGFRSLSFNAIGNKLASVSTAPDYSLIIWNWEEEKIELHSKAFGQDVFNVKFSVDDERRLVTSGAGHIKFWKTASTFTGLKLQGSIGKFGKIELSDISCFIEFPDGKVLSSTESGALLLWEGGFIKTKLKCDSNKLCHDGNITFLNHDRRESILITAGMDGYIRLWDFETINNVEIDSDNSMDHEIIPLAEFLICSNAGIIKCVDSGFSDDNKRHFVVIDSSGACREIRFQITNNNVTLVQIFQSADTDNLYIKNRIISHFHARKITGLDVSPNKYLAATCGDDGSIRFWDYKNRSMIACRAFKISATFLRWLPSDDDSIVVGFSDGTIKHLYLCKGDDSNNLIILKRVFKPHTSKISHISLNTTSNFLTTCSTDGTIFFFALKKADDDVLLMPLKFISMVTSPSTNKSLSFYCLHISWAKSNSTILCTCSDGILREVLVTNIVDEREASIENSSFEAFVPIKEMNNEIIATSGRDNKTDLFINLCCYCTCSSYNEESMIINYSQGEFKSELVEVYGDGASVTINSLQNHCSSLDFSCTSNFLLLGTDEGEVIIYPSSNLKSFIKYFGHPIDLNDSNSLLVKMSHDDKFILSSGSDGVLSIYCLRYETFSSAEINEAGPTYMHKILHDYHYSYFNISQDSLKVNEGKKIDFCDDLNANAYSIQDNRIKSEKDQRVKEIHDIHNKIIVSINDLQYKLRLLIDDNKSLPFQVMFISKDFTMDDRIHNVMKIVNDKSKCIIDVENKYVNEKSALLKRSLNSHFYGPTTTDHLFNISNDRGEKVIDALKISCLNLLSSELSKYFENVVKSNEIIDSQLRANEVIITKAVTTMTEIQDRLKSKSQFENNNTVSDFYDTASNVKIRKAKREERLGRIESHMIEKPSKTNFDNRDLNAIKNARETLGFCTMRCSENYVMSLQQRIDATSKKYRISLLEDGAFKYKNRFIDKEINIFHLGMTLTSTCSPSKDRLKSSSHVSLRNYKINRKDTSWKSSVTHPNISSLLLKSTNDNYSINSARKESKEVNLSSHDLISNISPNKGVLNMLSTVRRKENRSNFFLKSSLCTKYLNKSVMKNGGHSAKYFDEYEQIMKDFSVDKTLALIDFYRSDIKSLTIYQEYLAILDFEVKDDELQIKYQKVAKEKNNVSQDIIDTIGIISEKKDDLMTWDKRLMNITSIFKSLNGNDVCKEELAKIFKKKVRVGKKSSLEGNSSGDEDGEDEDNEENVDICPTGCDHTLFEKVLDLRIERASIENCRTQAQKSYEESKRINDKLNQKGNQIVKEMQNIDSVIKSVQVLKQNYINNLFVNRPVMTFQIYLSEQSSSSFIYQFNLYYSVFSMKKFIFLFYRIGKIESEKEFIYKNYKDLTKDKVLIRNIIERKRTEIKKNQFQCESLQILKFGQLADLGKLNKSNEDNIVDNDSDETLNASDLKNILSQLQSSLSSTTSHCVERLSILASLSEAKLGISREMNSQNTLSGGKDYEMKETKSLVSYIQLQRNEANQLRNEIFILSRKST